jgi:hypothetical protein
MKMLVSFPEQSGSYRPNRATAIVNPFAVSTKSPMTNVLQVATVRLNSVVYLSPFLTPHRKNEARQIVIIYHSAPEFLSAQRRVVLVKLEVTQLVKTVHVL